MLHIEIMYLNVMFNLLGQSELTGSFTGLHIKNPSCYIKFGL